MATQIGDLGVVLTANINQFQKALTQAQNDSKTFSSSIKGTLSEASSAVKGFVVAWAGIESVKAVFEKLNAVGDLVDISAGLNVSIESLQKLEYAGIGAGVSVETFHALLQRVSNASSEFADGSESIVAAFHKIGISKVDLNAPDETLMQIIDKLNKVPTAAEKMAVAMEFGGKRGATALLRLATEGKENLQATMNELAEKGLLIGTNTAKGADDAGDAVAKLSYEFQQKLKIAVVQNVETIGTLSTAFFDLLPAALTMVSKLAEGFVWLGKNIGIAAAKMAGFRTGEDALKGNQARITELGDQEVSLQNKYFSSSSVKSGKPTVADDRLFAQLQQIRATKSAIEKENAALYDAYKDTPVEETNKPKTKPDPNTPTLSGAGASKKKSKSDTKTPDGEQEKIYKDVSALLEKSDTARLDTLAKQTAEINKQKSVWVELDTATLDDTQMKMRTDAIAMYDQALTEVNKNELEIYDEQNKAMNDVTEGTLKYVEAQQAAAESVLDTIDPMRVQQRELEKIKVMIKDGYLPEEAYDQIKKIQDASKETTDWAKEMGMSFQSAFQDAVINGNTLSDVFKGLIKDIMSMILKITVLNPMMEELFGKKQANGTTTGGLFSAATSGAGSWLSSLFGGGATADGAAIGAGTYSASADMVFANGGIVGDGLPHYASGGVVGMSPGGAFVAGEAGPEGILPLTRINGKLGVTAQGTGSGTIINNYNTVNMSPGQTDEATKQAAYEGMMRAVAKQEIVAANRVGGTNNPMSIGG